MIKMEIVFRLTAKERCERIALANLCKKARGACYSTDLSELHLSKEEMEKVMPKVAALLQDQDERARRRDGKATI